jgi:hypothetical protein
MGLHNMIFLSQKHRRLMGKQESGGAGRCSSSSKGRILLIKEQEEQEEEWREKENGNLLWKLFFFCFCFSSYLSDQILFSVFLSFFLFSLFVFYFKTKK